MTRAGRRLDGQIVAWSRILDDEEVLCLFNSHGSKARSSDVLVDAVLNRTDGKEGLDCGLQLRPGGGEA